jgi:WD40 repeat protein
MQTHNERVNPYVGPRAFQTGEKLYGRDREIRQLADLLVAERIVLLHSPSGAGKTSMIRAGLIPQLEGQGFYFLPVVRVNQEPPATNGAGEVNRYVYSVLLSLEEEVENPDEQLSPEELQSMTIRDYLARRAERHLQAQPEGAFAYREESEQDEILIFDQFEEILTINPSDRAGKEAFFEQLGEALRDRQVWALFSMREDYMAALAPYHRPVPTRFHITYRLDLLGTQAAMQAIQAPARSQGVTFVDTAAHRLVDDLRKIQMQRPDGSLQEVPGLYVEPVQLQVVCYRLWGHLAPDDIEITEADLAEVGDVNTSLAEYYGERVAAVAAATGVRERAIREWFQRELITEQGIRSQVIMGQETSGGLSNAAIRQLEDAHLVRGEKRRGVTWFELAHDRLVDPVSSSNTTWFYEHLSPLQRQAGLWQAENRPERLLLRGGALDEAEQWAQAHAAELNATEQDFLEASRKARQREVEEQERQKQAVKLEEQARLARKLRQRLVLASIAAVVALLFFAAAAYFGYDASLQRDNAATNAAIAQSASTQAVGNAITAEANADLANAASTQASLERATALAASTQAVAGQTTAVAAEATSAYNADVAQEQSIIAQEQAQLAQSRQLASQSLGYLGSINQPAISPLLAAQAYNTTHTNEALGAMLYNIQLGLSESIVDNSGPLPVQNNSVYSVAISPDGQHMAWGLAEGTVDYWNLQTNQIEAKRQPHQDKVFSMTFSPDGRYLISGGNEGYIVIFDTENQTDLSTTNLFAPIFSLAVSPDGTRVAATRSTDIIILDISDPANPEQVQELQGINSAVLAVSWSPDGTRLASGGRDNIVRVWELDKGSAIRVLEEHTGEIRGLAWSPDSRLLASSGSDGQVIVWDVNNGVAAGNPLTSDVFDFFYGVSFSSDGRFLAAGQGNGTIRVWKWPSGELFQAIQAHDGVVYSVAFSPQPGTTQLASGGQDGRIGLYTINVQDPLGQDITPQGLNGEVLDIRLIDDDSRLLAVAAPNGVEIQEMSGGELNFRTNFAGLFNAAAFSPQGDKILLGAVDGFVVLADTVSGGVETRFPAKRAEITSLYYFPDGDRTAVATGQSQVVGSAVDDADLGQINLYDLNSGEAIGAPIVTGMMVTALAYDSQANRLVVGQEDGQIRFWDLDSGEETGLPLDQHNSPVTSLAIFEDGRLLASGGADRKLVLTDLHTSQALGPALLGANSDLSALTFTPDGTWLYSGTSAAHMLLWDTDPESWKARVCKQAGRNLTPNEWLQFMPSDQPYEKTCPEFTLEPFLFQIAGTVILESLKLVIPSS